MGWSSEQSPRRKVKRRKSQNEREDNTKKILQELIFDRINKKK